MTNRDNLRALLESKGYSTIPENDFIYDDLGSIQSLVGYEYYEEIEKRLHELADRIKLLREGKSLFCSECGRVFDLEQMKNNRFCVICSDQ